MTRGRQLLTTALVLAQLVSPPAAAWKLLPEPPASGYAMNLDLPTTTMQTIGYGLTSWNELARLALAKWNAVGVGSPPDFNFLSVASPTVAGNACAKDGVNEVRWAADNCGFGYGTAIAITNRWIANGARVEEDVIFNSNVVYNAYQGPLVGAASGTGTLNDFFRVAVHEFGHVVGLDHPDQAGQTVAAIMNSRVGDVDSLQADDIAGAHAIAWTAPAGATTTTTASTTTTTLHAAGQITSASYFPFQPGYEWTYRDEKPGAVATTYKRRVGQTQVAINGVMTYVWSDSNGVARYMSNDANGVRRHANGTPTFVTGFGNATMTGTYSPPEIYTPATVSLGSAITQSGSILQTTSDGTSRTDAFSQTTDFAAEKISVPAGTYDTIRVTNHRSINGTASTNIFWVADGVGMVKLQFDDGSGSVETFSLTSLNFVPAARPATLYLGTGWNLVGNSSSGALDVAAAFGDAAKITSVWKWNAASARWAFYAPSLTAQALTDYAASKGFDVLATVEGGAGFWVNAAATYTEKLPEGTAVSSLAQATRLIPGWNLLAVGDGKTPADFNAAIVAGASPPGAGVVSLWAWDQISSRWYFYAPSLAGDGTLAAYIASKGYLDFGTNLLDAITGFWVNKP